MKRILLIATLLCCCAVMLLAPPAFADLTPTPTPTPSFSTEDKWVFDPVVTELGKNSERARELLYWAFAHSPVYRAPVLGQMWGYARNIVYLFFVLVLIVAGVGYIFFKNWKVPEIFSGISPPIVSSVAKFIVKLAGLLLYATFSYILVLGLIQFGEVLMRFFIEEIGGCNLFNIKFITGAGTEVCVWPGDPGFQQVIMDMEKNYTDFVGYRNTNIMNLDMVNTSIFIIRLTSLTYNVMATLLILRHIILWFLLILSPFLALLTPFIFIRNIGWIWIGVFLQWLFYGPLMALFVAGLTRIWQTGIPYQFDFSRIDQDIGQIFPTSINILYGGPAQTLTPTNSANYIDTYAEYVIALIMLWACLFLPWLLLRIFRDYCCIGGEGQATLRQILDKIRGVGAPPPPPPPSAPTTIGEAIKLPFRKKAKVPEKMTLQKITDVSKAETEQLAQTMNLSIASLQEVARFEMDQNMQREAKTNLDKISRPEIISRSDEREKFSQVRSELFTRAARGDRTAQKLLSAARREPKEVFRVTPAIIPQVRTIDTAAIAQKTGISEKKAEGIINTLPTISATTPAVSRTIAQKVGISEKKATEVLKNIPTVMPIPAVIASVAQKTGVTEEKVREIVGILPTISAATPQVTQEVAQQLGISQEQAARVLKSIPTIAEPTVVAPPKKPEMVTVEDYEEVKKMWVKHYQEGEIPVTEKVKTREGWIETDVKKLTNALNLLTSVEEEDKKKGIEQVSNILPFLLLGGFSDQETITYLKAKLEAAKQVQGALEKEEEIKEKSKEEEELVEVPVKEKEEKLKEMELKAKRERKMPREEEKKNQPNESDSKSVNQVIGESKQ